MSDRPGLHKAAIPDEFWVRQAAADVEAEWGGIVWRAMPDLLDDMARAFASTSESLAAVLGDDEMS